MIVLIAGLILFLGVHSLQIVSPGIRTRVIERGGGLGAWMWPYTAVAALGFILIVSGYALARQAPVIVYDPPISLRHLALIVMAPVFPLLLAAYLPGRIRRIARHPMLIATVLWGAAHLLANGTLHALLLFGGIGVWAVIDLVSITRRGAGRTPRALPTRGYNDALAMIGGLALYTALLGGLHEILFGVAPI